MKKCILFFLFGMLSLSCLTKASAQSFNAGLLGGATFSQVDGDLYYGYNKLGFTAGAYVNLPLAEHFALQMELKYTQMGAHSSVKEVTEYNYNAYDLRLHYAEIPLMLQYDFGHFTVYGKKLDFMKLEAGIGLDFLMRYRGVMNDSPQEWKFNFFSVTGNFGLHFDLTDHWGLGARMMYSITPMQTNPTPQYFFDHSYNKVVQFTVTYNINSPLR